jgi:hypothetical protein
VPHVRTSVRGPKTIFFDCFYSRTSAAAFFGASSKTNTITDVGLTFAVATLHYALFFAALRMRQRKSLHEQRPKAVQAAAT